MSALNGKIIISTCTEDKAQKLSKLLNPKGASVYNFPMIEIKEAENNFLQIKETLNNIESYNWVIFTSSNGVKYFFYWLKKFNIPLIFNNTRFAVIGKSTANSLKSFGINPNYISHSKNSKEFAKELVEITNSSTKQILIPTGNLASDNLKNILCKTRKCHYLTVYNTHETKQQWDTLISVIEKDSYDIILFFSPSAVRGMINKLPNNINISNLKCVAMGSTTERSLSQKKIKSLFIPSIPNIETMVRELEEYYEISQLKNININKTK
ncbi:MAG: uroporphyrinogen-III synthase [Bacteroidales bacterium]|nr:uroporphyrinogen-III synthase [Bacteroidales bacterium]